MKYPSGFLGGHLHWQLTVGLLASIYHMVNTRVPTANAGGTFRQTHGNDLVRRLFVWIIIGMPGRVLATIMMAYWPTLHETSGGSTSPSRSPCDVIVNYMVKQMPRFMPRLNKRYEIKLMEGSLNLRRFLKLRQSDHKIIEHMREKESWLHNLYKNILSEELHLFGQTTVV